MPAATDRQKLIATLKTRPTTAELAEHWEEVRLWTSLQHDCSTNTESTIEMMEHEGELYTCFAYFMRHALSGEKRFLAAILGEWMEEGQLGEIVLMDPACKRMRRLEAWTEAV